MDNEAELNEKTQQQIAEEKQYRAYIDGKTYLDMFVRMKIKNVQDLKDALHQYEATHAIR